MNESEKVNEAMENEETTLFSEEIPEAAEDEFFPEDKTVGEIPVNEDVVPPHTNEAAVETKKPFILERTIIKAMCIFLAAVLVFGCCVAVNAIISPGIEGIWVMSKVYVKGNESEAKTVESSDKQAMYYQFSGEGKFSYRNGTVTQKMNWSFCDEKGGQTAEKTDNIVMYPEENPSYGSQFGYRIDGNAFSDKTLYLESGSENIMVYEFKSYSGSELPEYKMKADKDFKAVKALVGEWDDKKTGQSITINEDGSYELTVGDYLSQKGSYKVDEKAKTICLAYVNNGDESDTGDLPYTLDGKKLTIVEYEFTKK